MEYVRDTIEAVIISRAHILPATVLDTEGSKQDRHHLPFGNSWDIEVDRLVK